jgi:hypothetical protein
MSKRSLNQNTILNKRLNRDHIEKVLKLDEVVKRKKALEQINRKIYA